MKIRKEIYFYYTQREPRGKVSLLARALKPVAVCKFYLPAAHEGNKLSPPPLHIEDQATHARSFFEILSQQQRQIQQIAKQHKGEFREWEAVFMLKDLDIAQRKLAYALGVSLQAQEFIEGAERQKTETLSRMYKKKDIKTP